MAQYRAKTPDILYSMFSNMDSSMIDSVYEGCKYNQNAAMECLLEMNEEGSQFHQQQSGNKQAYSQQTRNWNGNGVQMQTQNSSYLQGQYQYTTTITQNQPQHFGQVQHNPNNNGQYAKCVNCGNYGAMVVKSGEYELFAERKKSLHHASNSNTKGTFMSHKYFCFLCCSTCEPLF